MATAFLRPLPWVLPREASRIADVYATSPAATATAGVMAGAAEKAVGKVADMAPVKPVAPPSMPTAPPKNLSGGFSIARQLGLGISRIVIDPGHGGHDPGAKGKGVTESEVVLDVALRLEKLLQKVPGVEVILTRRTDDFIPLPERTAMANREGADLFLSIHANASSSVQAHGIETYFLNFANNLSAAAVAARENAASGQQMAALPDLVKSIALNNKLDESRDFATQIQREMFDRLKGSNKTLRDLGVKQAPFVVLIGAAMPSVLAEISFVTNPTEARLLKGNTYRQKIAESLFNAIRKYQYSLKNGTAVALQ
jgi:N-acetylmuramoyl-L-alanine amidase